MQGIRLRFPAGNRLTQSQRSYRAPSLCNQLYKKGLPIIPDLARFSEQKAK